MPPLPATRKRRRPDLRKLMFVLPNLFTVSSIFCGFYAIIASTGPATGDQFFRASLAIFFGSFFDAFDGRVARLTRTQSSFGVELDSLADVITFGVAPGVLVYKWALADLGTGGMVIACIYTACGAIRLARFNVTTHAEHEVSPTGVSRFFTGMPIPLAAGAIVALVLALHGRYEPVALGLWPIGGIVLGLSFLMVSTIRYRTFKDAGLDLKTLVAFVLVIALAVFFALSGRLAQVFVVYFGGYILLGLVEQVFFGKKRHAAAAGPVLAGAAGAAGGAPVEPDPDEALLPAEEDEEDAPAAAHDDDDED